MSVVHPRPGQFRSSGVIQREGEVPDREDLTVEAEAVAQGEFRPFEVDVGQRVGQFQRAEVEVQLRFLDRDAAGFEEHGRRGGRRRIRRGGGFPDTDKGVRPLQFEVVDVVGLSVEVEIIEFPRQAVGRQVGQDARRIVLVVDVGPLQQDLGSLGYDGEAATGGVSSDGVHYNLLTAPEVGRIGRHLQGVHGPEIE